MQQIELTPDPFLLESLRSVGYSFEASVADLIDNSITAGARQIDLLSTSQGPFKFSVLDDGTGMDEESAVRAMTLAATSPSAARTPDDLGRFGLGLKTASLAQCRKLTLITRRNSKTTALRWDLDYVLSTGRWLVQALEEEEIQGVLGWESLAGLRHGTLVSWEELDRLRSSEGASQKDFDSAVRRVGDHLELVFHEFLAGAGTQRLIIGINGNPLRVLDPFLRSHRATRSQSQVLKVAGEAVPVTAYTLPFVSSMSRSDREAALSPGAFRDSQGFYVYRQKRLLLWGTWFRLNPRSEVAKLARVRVDVPNSLDSLWAIDIKKSSAIPPRELRDQLRTLANEFVRPSQHVQRFRGFEPRSKSGEGRAWRLLEDRDGFRYEINRESPLIRELTRRMDIEELVLLKELLAVIETGLPIYDAHLRLSEDAAYADHNSELEILIQRALSLRPIFAATHPESRQFVDMCLGMPEFAKAAGFEERLRQALSGTPTPQGEIGNE